ncbi:MAG: peptidylprolyl isomerase, partial [Anaerolineaceae bacterium]|nr:peptidylprolyl isomerase [Anaerolineaceae bacterium]
VLSAFAADGEWTAWEADLTGAAGIECTLAEPSLEDGSVRDVLGEVTENDWVLGPADAALTLVEYADFQCPYCSQAGLAALEFQAAHPDDVRYVYRHFPLSFHEKAPMSAYAADAAGKQGFFFNVEKWLYETQNEWTYLESLDVFDAWLRENIKTAVPDLDFEQWTADYESEEVRKTVDSKYDEVIMTGLINGTPTFFANYYQTSFDTAALEQFISLFKLQNQYRTACPVMAVEDGKDYRAVLHTSAGDVVVDLFAAEAPNLVSNFMILAKDGFYNNIRFHNVLPGFAAQAGDPTGSGVGLAGYYLEAENLNNGGFNEAGAAAMANTKDGKIGSQFFFTQDLAEYFSKLFAAQDPDLTEEELTAKVNARLEAMNAKYPVFGRVDAASLQVLPKISAETVIESVDIEVKGK